MSRTGEPLLKSGTRFESIVPAIVTVSVSESPKFALPVTSSNPVTVESTNVPVGAVNIFPEGTVKSPVIVASPKTVSSFVPDASPEAPKVILLALISVT